MLRTHEHYFIGFGGAQFPVVGLIPNLILCPQPDELWEEVILDCDRSEVDHLGAIGSESEFPFLLVPLDSGHANVLSWLEGRLDREVVVPDCLRPYGFNVSPVPELSNKDVAVG